VHTLQKQQKLQKLVSQDSTNHLRDFNSAAPVSGWHYLW
jgi:hypothetical protein